MADFEPTTTIYFFEGTGVNPQNQPFFTSEGSKLAWYNTHGVKQFTEYSYQRENRQYVRVEEKASIMRKYDMMCFRNDPADRWVFCRVVNVEFVNPNTSQITFETDSLQTFIDVCQFLDSWVEREMVENDWDGEYPSFNNLMPEGLEIGPLMENAIENTAMDLLETGVSVVALSAYDVNGEPNYSVTNDGIIIYGINRIVLQNASEVNSLLKTYENKGRLNGIVGMWLVPKGWELWNSKTYTIEQPTGAGSYQPKNSKVLSGEFCDIVITNRQGISSVLYPEFLFSRRGAGGTHNARFIMNGGFLAGGGGILMYPETYMQGTVDSNTRKDYGVVLPLDVQTCYVGNSYSNWVSQNKGALIIDALQTGGKVASGAATIGAGITMMNPLVTMIGGKQLSGAMYDSLGTMTKLMEKASNPAGAFGQVTAQSLMMRSQQYGFIIYYRFPTPEVAKSIDDFFTVYGYRTCRAKKPNVNTRPFWNYVKCAPAVVEGPFTSKDKENIQNILSAGVTFWHVTNGAVIGDYSMDNRG